MPFEQGGSLDDEYGVEISKLRERLSKFETVEGRLSGLSYLPHSRNEVIISTTPKAGTTWMQQICHQLRSGPDGDMSFEEISQVVPWIELAHDQGQNLDTPQYGHDRGLPRIFKTHAWAPHCPVGSKKIIMVRDPYDVATSFYNFFNGWFFPSGSISLETFIMRFWLARGEPESKMSNASYFDHLLSWYERRNDDDVLFLFYEDVRGDLELAVRKVAAFMSTGEHDFRSEEYIHGAVERSSLNFMKAHSEKFDEKLSKKTRNEACGLPESAGMNKSKVNKGESGSFKEVALDVRHAISDRWMRQIKPVTGCDSYDQLRLRTTQEEHNEKPT